MRAGSKNRQGKAKQLGCTGQGCNSILQEHAALHCSKTCGSPQVIKALQSRSLARRAHFYGYTIEWEGLDSVFGFKCCFWLFVDVQLNKIFLLTFTLMKKYKLKIENIWESRTSCVQTRGSCTDPWLELGAMEKDVLLSPHSVGTIVWWVPAAHE